MRVFLANNQTDDCSRAAGMFLSTAGALSIIQIEITGYSNQTAAEFNQANHQLIKRRVLRNAGNQRAR